MNPTLLINIIYDGIHNSVFEGQVLQPLLQRIETNPHEQVVLISFEKAEFNNSLLETCKAKHPQLLIIIAKKIPYIGMISVWYAVWQLKNILKPYATYSMLARGPIAGLIASKALTSRCASLTIQGRGLLTEEYAYAHRRQEPPSTNQATNQMMSKPVRPEPVEGCEWFKSSYSFDQVSTDFSRNLNHNCKIEKNCSFPSRTSGRTVEKSLSLIPHMSTYKKKILDCIHYFRLWQFRSLEKAVYQTNNPRITIQAVSSALKIFLVDTYSTNPNRITIAEHDTPPVFTAAQCMQWKQQTRQELGIPLDARVYCYNGSCKPWQCPEETISFFKHQQTVNPQSFLLIISKDKEPFEQLLTAHNIDVCSYKIMSAAHSEIYRYVAAADVGLLFREPHVINWISRPTKVLEYRAVGLEVMHNGTVAWLAQEQQSQTQKTVDLNCPTGS